MQYLFLFFIFIFGLIIGSFLNCLIWRLHKEESMWGRSYCPKCKKQIAWYDNIPVLSFCFLLGKCRHCRKAISWQYPAVELITGMLFLISCILESGIWNQANQFLIPDSQFLIHIFRDWLLISVMIVVFIYDLRWYLILDIVTLPACIIFLFFNIFLGLGWTNILYAGLIGVVFFGAQFLVSRGKWIGGGDIRLGLLMGLALGRVDLTILAIMIAYFIGSIVGVGLIVGGKKKWGSKLPLGVFLSVATIITLFWGQEIIAWYFNML
jgi:prepilin signal peptidase PulO-like enzyme (type II secretory pathway)